jgi:signal transduction histidine kinase
MSKNNLMKNRIDELFSEDVLSDYSGIKENRAALPNHPDSDDKLSLYLLNKKNKELAYFNDIGDFLEKRPAKDELFQWLIQTIPNALLDPVNAVVGITYQNEFYGNPEVILLSHRIEQDIRTASRLDGKIHIAYKQEKYASGNEDFFVIIAKRVSEYLEHFHLMNEMERRTYELAVLNELSHSLSSRLSTAQIAKVIYEYTAKLMEAADFFVAYYHPEKELIFFPYLYLGGEELEPFSRPVGNSLTDYILRKGEPLLFSSNVADHMKSIGLDVVTVGNDKPALSWLGVPIKYENEVLGVISLQTTEVSGLYTERDRDLLMAISRQSAVAIHGAITFQRLAKSSSDLETIARLSTSVTAILDPDHLMQMVVDQAKESFNLYHAHIYLLDQTGENLVLAAGAGEVGKRMLANKWSIEVYNPNSLVGRAARERKGVTVNDVRKEAGFLLNPLLPETLSEMAIPITGSKHILGVLDVQSNALGTFTSEDINIFTSLAAQIAVALQNARQYSETQLAFRQSDMLYKGSDRVVHATDPQSLLEAVVESTPGRDCEQAIMILFDKPWGDSPPDYLKMSALWTPENNEAPRQIPAITEQAKVSILRLINPSNPTIIEDLNSDSRVDPGFRELFGDLFGMKNIALFPLATGNQFIGVIALGSANQLQWSESKIRHIVSLNSQAATVLQSQMLQTSLQLQISEMETLQKMLSREAWSSYLTREDRARWGYEFTRVDVQPLMESDSGNGHSAIERGFSAPLEVRGEVIGGLGIHPDDYLPLTEEEKNFLESVAEQVSQALERARLIEQTQKKALELQTVAQVSSTSSTLLEPNELLQSVVDLAKNSFGLYHAHIYLLGEEEEKLVLNSGAGDVGRKMVEEGWVIFINEDSIVSRAARTQKGQIVGNVLETPDYLPNPLLPETKSEMAIPMVVGNELLGVFDVQSEKLNRFTDEDLLTFTTLASQTAVALQNARLYAEQSITVEKLRELDLLKTSFLANMSHELRTPLNSILGFTQVILEGIDGPLTDYMVSDLQLIEKNGKHLLNLINEVLDMAKIESGKMSLTIETVNLRELLDDVLETTSAQAREKSIYLSLETDPDEKLVIDADVMRLRQIMINLVGNSIKFTETGGVTVKASKLSDKILIQVEDTGLGILDSNLERIFEAFSQVDTSTTRKVGGTGLGLPISRKLVEMHGGRLWAESEGLGKGATMYLILPAKIVSEI